MKKDNKNTH